MPVSNSFKNNIQLIAEQVDDAGRMSFGCGGLVEVALNVAGVDLGAPTEADPAIEAYIAHGRENQLFDAIKGTGKQNRSFQVTSDNTGMRSSVSRFCGRYGLKGSGRLSNAIRILLPLGVCFVEDVDIAALNIDEYWVGQFADIATLLTDEGMEPRIAQA